VNGNNRIKWLLQTISLVVLGEFAFYGIFRCPFSIPFVSCESCPVIQCPGRKLFLVLWIVILGSAVISGRVFCGYSCPVGTVSEILGKLVVIKRKRRDKVKYKKFFFYGKYIFLIASFLIIIVFNNPRWAIPIRIGDFFNSIKLTIEHANSLWIVRTIFIAGAIGTSLFLSRIWCRYLCPAGGMLEIIKGFSIFKYFMTSDCNNCNECSKVCTMETRPSELNCTNCGECKDVCPVNAIRFGMKFNA